MFDLVFDLERELKTWSRTVLPAGCNNEDERRAELEDHLSCHIAALREGGMPVEQAYRAAIDRMGDQARLAKEFAKNRSLLSTLCLVEGESMIDDSNRPLKRSAKLAGVILGQSIIWATVMMAVSAELSETQLRPVVMQWLTAGWFASFMLPVVLMEGGSVKAECAWIMWCLGLGKAW